MLLRLNCHPHWNSDSVLDYKTVSLLITMGWIKRRAICESASMENCILSLREDPNVQF